MRKLLGLDGPKNKFEKMMEQSMFFPGVGMVTGGGQIAGKVAGSGLANTMTRTKDVLGHIFRNSTGHVNPASVTSQNRYIQIFEKVANSLANINPNGLTSFQRNATGFQGFSQTFRNGQQVWVQTFNGKIINAGVNTIPK